MVEIKLKKKTIRERMIEIMQASIQPVMPSIALVKGYEDAADKILSVLDGITEKKLRRHREEHMKLEDQVISLDLAKRLKELGVKQESLYYWFSSKKYNRNFIDHKYNTHGYSEKETFSAFSVAELGEMLPEGFEHKNMGYLYRRCLSGEVAYCIGDKAVLAFSVRPEANARARMLCYLLENKLIEIREEKE